MPNKAINTKNKCLIPIVLEKAWYKLAETQCVDNALLRHEVASSWKRCLASNIDPSKAITATNIKNFIEQDKKSAMLLAASHAHVQQLYDTIRGHGYIIILTDAQGIILTVLGDNKVMNFAESVYLIPGANCSEDAIGTNSLGTCLVQKKPIQIFSHEHYCQYYHDWSCSCAPILDRQGNLLGSLDISNIDNKIHSPVQLNLVRMTAKAIGMEWDFHALQEDIREKYYYFNMAIDSVSDSLIFLDNQNNISHINKNALQLLGDTETSYIGQNIHALVKEREKIKQVLAEKQPWASLHFQTPRGLTAVSISANPVKDKDLKQIGTICSIKEKAKNSNNKNIARYSFDNFICVNTRMQSVLQQARKVAATESSILIEGESGTGKEILAQAVHNSSPRRQEPFVAINCAALPLELIQSELFGYEEGAFTGAKRGGKIGKFELAQGGTLFLDEIGDMPLPAQANLLRALQEKCITRLGGQMPVAVDVRIIAATNKDLLREIAQERFRSDLYYRLAGERLHVPPLRERKEDIWPIIYHIVKTKPSPTPTTTALQFTHQVKALLEMHTWPGNVRELENVVMFFLNRLHDHTVTIDDLPPELQPQAPMDDTMALKQVEHSTILATVAKHGHNMTASAKALGISRTTLYRKMRQLERATG